MTPEQKAEELVNKFKSSQSHDGYNDVRDIHASIRCALIAVDEIIENGFNPQLQYNYWQEVKQEIQKL